MSTLRVNTIQNQPGTGAPSIDGLAKAWVNFNGTGTVAIRASYNVTSITDNGTGDYTVNFTTALADANYSPLYQLSSSTANSARIGGSIVTQSTTTFRFNVGYQNIGSGGGLVVYDDVYVNATFFR
jgi:hypothetical protein